jgi:hypothetical protein
VATTDVGQQVFLPPLIRHLEAHAPHVTLEKKATSVSSSAMSEELATGEIDLALGFIPHPGPDVLQEAALETGYVGVIEGDRTEVETAISLKQFKNMRHVVPKVAGAGHAASIDAVLRLHGISSSVVLRVTHLLSITSVRGHHQADRDRSAESRQDVRQLMGPENARPAP